jgi:hypothetical protein
MKFKTKALKETLDELDMQVSVKVELGILLSIKRRP